MPLSQKEVLDQSNSAMKQWGPTWERHAAAHGEMYKQTGKVYKDLLHIGAGKTLVCCGFGPSFEQQIDTLEKYKDNVDVACVDKCMGYLFDAGITPKYVFISDAGIDYDKYCAPWIDKTENSILLSCVTSNPTWAQNWKGPRYWYVNKDNIESEKIYGPISGVHEVIPAASNVGNSVVVFASLVMGYDQILLIGYDYGWTSDDNYYAFNDSDKRYWMRHAMLVDVFGNLFYTSQNLLFSARWMSDFYHGEIVPKGRKVYNCSCRGLLGIQSRPFGPMLRVAGKRELSPQEKNAILQAHIEDIHVVSGPDAHDKLNEALTTHKIVEVIVRHLPEASEQCLMNLVA